MKNFNVKTIHPLLQTVIDRIVNSGADEVYVTPDGHLFVLSACRVAVQPAPSARLSVSRWPLRARLAA